MLRGTQIMKPIFKMRIADKIVANLSKSSLPKFACKYARLDHRSDLEDRYDYFWRSQANFNN